MQFGYITSERIKELSGIKFKVYDVNYYLFQIKPRMGYFLNGWKMPN